MDPEDRILLESIDARLERLELALARLVAAWDRFEPLLDKFSGGSLIGSLMGRPKSPTSRSPFFSGNYPGKPR